ncbi:cadherin-17 [Stegostoma tigrinum]|uniref:cadherin-17 n=1 Tax=Stegostoma tigrinum TaxID=3053191 RepID=UPI00202B2C87|nr:cadherin-17 [Stegostoma tigrinum]XP_048385579.1 cadherin-17 [Stegostoma tigrinum]
MKTSNHQNSDKPMLLFFIVILTAGVNANLPKGQLKTMELSVTEETDVPLMIYKFTSENADVKSFAITSETDGVFNIFDDWLTANKTLDREKKASYELKIVGLNDAQETVEGPEVVTILLRDINDNQPIFTKNQFDGIVRQNSRPGKPFMYVTATDLDDPETRNAKIYYSILQQIPNNNDIMFFQIDNQSGRISTTEEGYQLIDPKEEESYQLIVSAKDSAPLPLSTNTIVKIAVKENLWKSPGEIEIMENSTDPHPKIITRVQWNEPGAIYELKSKVKIAYPKFPFTIDANGNISVTEPLDREEISEYTLLAYALDENREPLEEPLEIVITVKDINDNHPTCNSEVTFLEVQENEKIGSYIGTVIAHDMDEDGTENTLLSYNIINQEPKVPGDQMFNIDDFKGDIKRFKGRLEKRIAPDYVLTVLVRDQPGLFTECIVNISVIDINDMIPIFEKSEYGPITLPEDTSLGTVLIEIQATDDDEPFTGSSEIEYRVVEGDANGTFKIITDQRTNKGMVQLAKPLNFEESSFYKLKINATNPEPLVEGVEYNSSSFTFLIVNVTDTDEPPQFLESSYRTWILENASRGDTLLKVEAKDPEGGEVRYSLQDPLEWFRIDSKTGEIFVKDELDAEKQKYLKIMATAMEKDRPKKSSTAEISIYFKDVNDNVPKLAKDSSQFFICLPAEEEKKIIIHAVDDDKENGPPFKFSFPADPGKEWKVENINGTHALVTMKFGRHSEETKYNPRVLITDSGSPPQQGTDNIAVTVCKCTDKNVCFIPVEGLSKSSKIALAVGLLLGTFVFIGLILAVVLIKMKRKKGGKGDKIDPKAARTVKETIPLANA